MLGARLIPIVILSITLVGCSSSSTSEQQSNSALETDSAQLDSILVAAIPKEKIDVFQVKIDSIRPVFVDWGFKEYEEKVLKDSIALYHHWWLKKFGPRYGRRERLKQSTPTKKDFLAIDSIRQYHFISGWRYVIEEWRLNSVEAATRWQQLAKEAHKVTYTLEKPPNVFWREENKLCFIMATAASQWFEYSDQVMEQFTGKTRLELRIGMGR